MTGDATNEAAQDLLPQLLGVFRSGMIAVMIAVGNRTGLFDVMAPLPPSTSMEIAKAAGLHERYVREWLAALTTGGIVHHDPETMTFSLPPGHALLLTHSGEDNLGVMAELFVSLAEMVRPVVDCFRQGGGVALSAYPARMKELLGAEKAPGLDAYFDVVLPVVPGLIERLQTGIDVLDVGCGAGHQVNVMAKAFPASRFVGLDIVDASLAVGRSEASRQGLTNATFVERDAAKLDGSEQYDFITTFDAVHDQARPDLVLSGIAQSLRPGGAYLCIDVATSSALADNMARPLAPLNYGYSCLYCVPSHWPKAVWGSGRCGVSSSLSECSAKPASAPYTSPTATTGTTSMSPPRTEQRSRVGTSAFGS